MDNTTEIDFTQGLRPPEKDISGAAAQPETSVEGFVEELLPAKHAVLKTDGGSRGNPGISGIGFVLSTDEKSGSESICEGGAYIGIATNNQAEYQALIWGLQNAAHEKVCTLDVYADSELVIKQLLGEYKVKNEGIKPLFAEAQGLLQSFERCSLTHVLREHNSAADALANKAMDMRASVGTYCVPFATSELFAAAGTEASTEASTPAAASTPTPTPTPANPSEPDPTAAAKHEAAAEQSQLRDATARDTEGSSCATHKTTSPSHSSHKKGRGMYTLSIKGHFDAAHALVGYPGECKNLHGHTWDVEVSVRGNKLDDVGIVYDFKDLKAHLNAILDTYDHVYLNDIAPYDRINSTAENLARVVYEHLEAALPAHVELVEVAVWESPRARVTYTCD